MKRFDIITGLWLQYLGGGRGYLGSNWSILEGVDIEDLTVFFGLNRDLDDGFYVGVRHSGALVSIYERTSHEHTLSEGLWSEIIAEVVS